MLGLTRKGEYAIRGMIFLARQPAGKMVLVQDIAAAAEAPTSFLAKIFQVLVKGGLVLSARGSGGGFTLGRPAGEITLRQLVELVEGPILPNRCLLPDTLCGGKPDCRVHRVWHGVQNQVAALLDQVSLAELAA